MVGRISVCAWDGVLPLRRLFLRLLLYRRFLSLHSPPLFVRFYRQPPPLAFSARLVGKLEEDPVFCASAIFSQRTFWAAALMMSPRRGVAVPTRKRQPALLFIPPKSLHSFLQTFAQLHYFHQQPTISIPSFTHNHQKKHPTSLFRQSRTLNE